MQHSRFTEQQIAFVLDQVARGAPVMETCRNAGITVQTFFRWRAKYSGLTPGQIRRLNEIEDEARREKQRMASVLTARAAPGGGAQYQDRALRSGAAPAATSMTVNRYWQPLSAYLPAGNRLDVRGQTRAFLKRAQGWAGAHSRELRRGSARAPGGKRRAGLLSSWLRTRKLLILSFAGGLVGGFAMGLEPTTRDDEPTPVPVNMNLRVNSYGELTSTMDKGWSRPEPWGRWMDGASASIMLGFDGPARGDVELLVEARARPAADRSGHTLVVRFNGAELGRWLLPADARQLRRRFIVPSPVFNRSTAAQLTFEIAGKAPAPAVFGLEALSLRDARFLHGYRGYLDSCHNGKLVGWAIAEGTAVSVAASADGQPLAATLTSVERQDLAKQGLPIDAGFELALAEPVAPGRAIDVRFANGRPLSGSPCKP